MLSRRLLSGSLSRGPAAAACAGAGAGLFTTQRRHLNIHEYVAKGFLNNYKIVTEQGSPATDLEGVRSVASKIGTTKKVVKAQILAGGRGKGTFQDGLQGGVHIVEGVDAAVNIASKMLGNTLITKQTGPAGQKVRTLFVTEAIPAIKRELYLALVLDRTTQGPMFIGCAEGGMGIEELAHSNPEAIIKMPVNIREGVTAEKAKEFATKLGFTGVALEGAVDTVLRLYTLAKERDATQVEINPLAELHDGRVMCLDAKINFDDNAKFRQASVWAHEDTLQADPRDVEAAKLDINYIALDGNVGCMVNGAGLAMATMDIIQKYGGRAANFLDVGGSANTEQITQSLILITRDPNVQAILVNIFGGIMQCDVIANGIVEAVRKVGIKVPLVVRLEGSNVEKGKEILAKSGLKIIPANNLDDAAQKITQQVQALKK